MLSVVRRMCDSCAKSQAQQSKEEENLEMRSQWTFDS